MGGFCDYVYPLSLAVLVNIAQTVILTLSEVNALLDGTLCHVFL